jgi:hypothetical protein
MPVDLMLPISAVFAVGLIAALTWARGFVPVPRIQVRAQNEKHGPLRVIELALVLSPAIRLRRAAAAAGQPARGTEFVVYITLKTCNP